MSELSFRTSQHSGRQTPEFRSRQPRIPNVVEPVGPEVDVFAADRKVWASQVRPGQPLSAHSERFNELEREVSPGPGSYINPQPWPNPKAPAHHANARRKLFSV